MPANIVDVRHNTFARHHVHFAPKFTHLASKPRSPCAQRSGTCPGVALSHQTFAAAPDARARLATLTVP